MLQLLQSVNGGEIEFLIVQCLSKTWRGSGTLEVSLISSGTEEC